MTRPRKINRTKQADELNTLLKQLCTETGYTNKCAVFLEQEHENTNDPCQFIFHDGLPDVDAQGSEGTNWQHIPIGSDFEGAKLALKEQFKEKGTLQP